MEDDRYKKDSVDSKWRHDIKFRAGYRCEVCNRKKKAIALHAHHLYSYSDNPDLRVDLKNGKSLCRDCHDSFHDRFGKGGNNPQQFDQFLKDYKIKKMETERLKLQKKFPIKKGKKKQRNK